MEVYAPPSLSSAGFIISTPPNHITAPSTSQRTFFYSAPTSPSHDHDSLLSTAAPSAVPFYWEQRPGVAKVADDDDEEQEILKKTDHGIGGDDFEFDFGDHVNKFERNSLSADELFDGGKIKPLKPPPGFHYSQNKPLDSPKSPRSPRKLIAEAFSPRRRKEKYFDPFAAALEQTRKSDVADYKRGRERKIDSSSRPHKLGSGTRSLSPFRVNYDHNSSQPSPSSSIWFKKWKIKDLLLFRSASEGRAADIDLLKKSSLLKNHKQESSFSSTSTDSAGSVASRGGKQGPPISAHELFYSARKSLAKEMEMGRSFLPHRQRLLGCLGFYPNCS